MLEIINFSKTYKGGKKAVSNLNLEILPGEIYGFRGHNGAGKTTTIKAVVGILDFEEGEIRIDGHSVKEEPLVCKSLLAYICLLYTSPRIYPFPLPATAPPSA